MKISHKSIQRQYVIQSTAVHVGVTGLVRYVNNSQRKTSPSHRVRLGAQKIKKMSRSKELEFL